MKARGRRDKGKGKGTGERDEDRGKRASDAAAGNCDGQWRECGESRARVDKSETGAQRN